MGEVRKFLVSDIRGTYIDHGLYLTLVINDVEENGTSLVRVDPNFLLTLMNHPSRQHFWAKKKLRYYYLCQEERLLK